MKRHSSGFYIGIVSALVIGFAIVALVWQGLASMQALGYEPGVLQAVKTGSNSATLNLATYPDSHVCHADDQEPELDWVTYCPSTTFEVPANSIVTVVIKNYDGQTALHNDFFRQVQGTIGGVETVNGQPYSLVDATTVSHTFTIQSKPGSDHPMFISVPVIGVADDAPTDPNTGYPTTPNVISFQFKTGPAGTIYIFKCYDPCGNGLQGDQQGFAGPMATTGYMAGMMTVSSY